jgi:hypothetical protein
MEEKLGLKELVVDVVVGGFTIGGFSSFLVNDDGIWVLPKVEEEPDGPPTVVDSPGFSFSYLFK